MSKVVRTSECQICGKSGCSVRYCFRMRVHLNKAQQRSYAKGSSVKNWRDYGRGIVRKSGLLKRFRPHAFYLAVNEPLGWRVYTGTNSGLISLMVDSMGSGFRVYLFSEYHTEMMEFFFWSKALEVLSRAQHIN